MDTVVFRHHSYSVCYKVYRVESHTELTNKTKTSLNYQLNLMQQIDK